MLSFLVLAINVLSLITLLADGQSTVCDYKDSSSELQMKLEEHDEKLQFMIQTLLQSMSNRIEKVETLLETGFQQIKENSVAMSRGINQSLEDQKQKLRRLYQNITETREMIDDRFQSGFQQTKYKLEEHDSNLKLIYQNLSSELVKVQQSLFQRAENQSKEHDGKIEFMYRNLSSENEKIQQLLLQTASHSCSPLKSVGVYDCSDFKANGFIRSGTYGICVDHQQKRYRFDAYCDMNTANGTWLVFQRRKDGSQNFARRWTDYANGFGDLNGDFWLGNEFLYLLTSKRQYKLRIDLENWTGVKRYAEYSNFSVSSSADKYRLVAGGYSGTAGDSLDRHNGHSFTTYDNDNDGSYGNCALSFGGGGGWWYNNWLSGCRNANLNGLYYFGGNYSSRESKHIIEWYHWYRWNSFGYSFKTTEMKISPIV